MSYIRGQQIMKYKLRLFVENKPEEGMTLHFAALRDAKLYVRAAKAHCQELTAVIEIVE
jgi:hypothetical protein